MAEDKNKFLNLFKKKEKLPTYKSWWRDTFEAIIVAALLALFLRTFVFGTFKIPTPSMVPNLLIGDHLIVNSFMYGPTSTGLEDVILPHDEVERGDVIVFNYPYDMNTQFVKRVIGLPGDEIRMEGRKVFINDEYIDEPYAHYKSYTPDNLRKNFGPYRVPKNSYFVMGDNRDNSNDSRFWGTVPRNLIRGRAFMIYWCYEASTEEYLATGMDRVKNLFKTMINFFGKTKWERTFKIVN